MFWCSFVCVSVCVLSCVWRFTTPRTVAHQAPLSMGFSKQEYWSGFPCPPPGDLPGSQEDWTWLSCIAARFFTIWATREAPLIGMSFFLIILFMTVLVFTACGPSLVAENGAYSLVAAQGLLTVVASLVAEMGSRAWGFQQLQSPSSRAPSCG